MSKELPPSRTADQYVVRFPDGMRDRIAEVAKTNGRSMNAEIVARLAQSFEPSGNAAHLQEAVEAHKQTAGVLGMLSTSLANMLLTAVRLFTTEQRKNAPQIEVWEAVAKGVVEGRGTAIADFLQMVKPDKP